MYGSKQGWSLSTYPIHAVQKKTRALKKCTFYSVSMYSHESTNDGHYFLRDHHFTRPFEPREGLPIWRAKVVPSFLSYFKVARYSSGSTTPKFEHKLRRHKQSHSLNFRVPLRLYLIKDTAKLYVQLFRPK